MTTEQEHFCKIHEVPFKRNENDKGVWYSHKVEETGQWCTEKKPQGAGKPFGSRNDPERTASIELQHYTDNVKDLWIAGKLKDDSKLVLKYKLILATKLGLTTPDPAPALAKPVTSSAPMKQAVKEVGGELPDDWFN